MSIIRVKSNTGDEIANASTSPHQSKTYYDHLRHNLITPMERSGIRQWHLGKKAYGALSVYAPILGNLFKVESLPEWDVVGFPKCYNK